MSEQKMVTEREAIMRERQAFADAIAWVRSQRNEERGIWTSRWIAARETFFPLPKVTRPRVVQDAEWPGTEWRCVDGSLQMRRSGVGPAQWQRWTEFRNSSDWAPLPKRVAMWADLHANPLEEVEADT